MKLICFLITLFFSLLLPTRLLAAELVLLGTHPTSPLTAYPTIHTLKAFENRIYLGYGDWNLFPAVVVASFDPASSAFHLEFSANTDSIGIFREIGGTLYMPSIDPVLHADFREYSYRAGGVWRDSSPTGMRHIFDVATLDGTDLWLVGAKAPNETGTEGAAVFRSPDGGRNWQDVTIQSALTGDDARYYWGFPLRGRFYVRDTCYEGTNGTRTANAPYRHFNRATPMMDGTNEFMVGVTGWVSGIGRPLTRLLVTYDTQTWRTLVGGNVVYHFTVSGSNLFTLETNVQANANALWMASAVTPTNAVWQRLNFNNVPANAKAIEVLKGVIYVADTQGGLWAGRLDGTAINPSPATVVNELADDFGRALSVDGDVLAVGAPDHSGTAPLCGQVTIWERDGTTAWAPTAKIDPPVSSFSGWFGKTVVLKDDVLAVVESGRDLSRADRGSSAQVHLYERAGQNWAWRQSLNHPYAQAVALESGWLAVGATNSLFLYSLVRGPNIFEVTLQTNFVVASSYFQDFQALARVSLEDNLCALAVIADVGAINGGAGTVQIYQRDEGNAWRLQQVLQSPSPTPAGLALPPDRFGFSLTLQRGWLAVGAPRDDTSALQAGAVHLYEKTSGTSFILRQSVHSPLNQPEAAFGVSVALKDSTLLVGSPGAELNGERHHGSVFVFRRETNEWRNVAKVFRPSKSTGEFGTSVAFGSNWLAASSRFSDTSSNLTDRVAVWQFGPAGGDLSAPRRLGNGGFEVRATGELGGTYHLQTTADLMAGNWRNVFPFTLTMPTTNLMDTMSATLPQRFYRLRSEPSSAQR